MFNKKALKKFGFRFLLVNLVFFVIKLTVEHQDGEVQSFFSPQNLFHYTSAFVFFMVTWEVNDWLLKKQRRKGVLDFKSGLRIFAYTMILLVSLSAIVYYFSLFHYREALGIVCEDPVLEFWSDLVRASTIGCTVIFFNFFHFSVNQGNEMKRQMEDLKKEMMASKYTSLKNQISPHFLFNSLNTLTSLMYEDRDLASDFVTRLASSYRYILDNREEDLVSLKKELNFLDAFVFMMNVRHKDAVIIETNMDIRPEMYLIPTLSLQMLVENALKHNYYSKEKPLLITISSIEKDVLVVRNNLRRRELKEETTRLGLKNIRKRYSYYSNKAVVVKEGEDFFEVILPLLHKNVKKLNLLTVS